METANTHESQSNSKAKFDGTVALLAAGSIYLLLGAAFNQLIQSVPYFLVLAVVSGLIGLYAVYLLNAGKENKSTVAIALTAIVIGFLVTFIVFLFGVISINPAGNLLGLTGSAWIIYALAAFWLYRNRTH